MSGRRISLFEILLIIILVLLATTDDCQAESYSIEIFFDETESLGSDQITVFLDTEPKMPINTSIVPQVAISTVSPPGSVLLELAVLQEGDTWHVVSATNFQLTKPRTILHFPSDFNKPQTQKNYQVSTPIPPPPENGEAGGWVVWLLILLGCGLASAVAFFMVSQSRKRRRVPLPPPPPEEDVTKAWSQTRIIFRRDDFHHLPFSEYRTEHLASGGQAQIYKAWHPMMRKYVAIKQLDPKRVSDPFIRDHFHRGAQITFNLIHPNIVHFFEDCIEGNLHFLVMELLGASLEGIMREKGLLPIATVLVILDQIGRALAFAHARGIVHRDVKPGNILQGLNGQDFKILDFEIALDLRLPRLTVDSQILLGTLSYMSLEQVQMRKDIDGRSDVYSLAVVAYRCLTGRLPFQAEDLGEMMEKQCNERPLDLREWSPQAPGWVADAIMKELQSDRRLRFETVQDFLQAIQRRGK